MARKTLEQIDASLARWQTRLRRAVNSIERLQKQRKRIAKAKPPAKPEPSAKPAPPVREVIEPPKGEIDTSIPAFLQRKKPDPVAEQIRQDQADAKRRKTAGRIATMKAKRSGETRKMPLTGKAALEAIRG